jgi:hypothetical protein
VLHSAAISLQFEYPATLFDVRAAILSIEASAAEISQTDIGLRLSLHCWTLGDGTAQVHSSDLSNTQAILSRNLWSRTII